MKINLVSVLIRIHQPTWTGKDMQLPKILNNKIDYNSNSQYKVAHQTMKFPNSFKLLKEECAFSNFHARYEPERFILLVVQLRNK